MCIGSANTEASRPLKNTSVRARIAEVQAAQAKHNDATLGSVIADLRRVVAALEKMVAVESGGPGQVRRDMSPAWRQSVQRALARTWPARAVAAKWLIAYVGDHCRRTYQLTIAPLCPLTNEIGMQYRSAMQTYPTTDQYPGAALFVGVILFWLVVVVAGLILEQAP